MISPTDNNPYLDVSQLEAPEPITMILDALDILPSGNYLHVYHRREPFPLYKMLHEMNMKWQTHSDDDGMFHILIWSYEDKTAEEKALQR